MAHNAPFEIGDHRSGAGAIGNRLIKFEPIGDAAVKSLSIKLNRLVVKLERAARHLKLEVELAQIEVSLRDIGNQRNQHAAPIHFGCDVDGGGRFGLAPDPAEYVGLPDHVEDTEPILE